MQADFDQHNEVFALFPLFSALIHDDVEVINIPKFPLNSTPLVNITSYEFFFPSQVTTQCQSILILRLWKTVVKSTFQ